MFDIPETDSIYFQKTKDYFGEVVTSYSIGNYRSANVMLYSVAICDILFKLEELEQMYDDAKAKELLEMANHKGSDKNKSKWEWDLIERISKETEFLDPAAFAHLKQLRDERNMSAHPSIDNNYELYSPSKETTIANIKNVLKEVLAKPPIFIKSVVDQLTDDLQRIKEIFSAKDDKLKRYLDNKYFCRMTDKMKLKTMEILWRFCFNAPDNADCMANLDINRKALEILIDGFGEDAASQYIDDNKTHFGLTFDDKGNKCCLSLIRLLASHPHIYSKLAEETQTQIGQLIEKDCSAAVLSWFKFKSTAALLDSLKKHDDLILAEEDLKALHKKCSDVGDLDLLLDFFVTYYGNSFSFTEAEGRFQIMIAPYLHEMSRNHFEKLIKLSDSNYQIYHGWYSLSANTEIIKAAIAKDEGFRGFDFSQYPDFNFNENILSPEDGTKKGI